MKFLNLLLVATALCSATSGAQDAPPPLFTSVARKDQTVVVTLKPAKLMLIGDDGGVVGRFVYAGQSFTLKDGQWIRFFDGRERIRYDIEVRLSAAPPDLHIRTTTGPGVQDPISAAGTPRFESVPYRSNDKPNVAFQGTKG
jgi:hypothetical protein